MSIFSKIGEVLTGNLAGTIVDTVKDYFPPDMSDEQKAQLNLSLKRLELDKEQEVNKAIAEAERSLNERIEQHEGTAKDLLALPFVGRIIIFARGCQRPVWGFGVMWADVQWFSGQWGSLTDQQESTLWVINLLVLGFLFGERAVKNVMPLVSQYMGKK